MAISSDPLTEIGVCFFEYVGQGIMPLDKPGVQCLDKKVIFNLLLLRCGFPFFIFASQMVDILERFPLLNTFQSLRFFGIYHFVKL